MNGPDGSLFQGSEDLMIQNYGQLDDVEDEAEEDRRRMDEELKFNLRHAFDDVTDNDDDDYDEEENKYDHRDDVSSIAGDGEFPKLEQSYAESVTNQDCPTNDSAVLDFALTTVMSMGKPSRNRYTSQLACQLPSVQEDGGMFDDQEFMPSGNTTSDHFHHCYRSSPGGYGDHKDVPEESQILAGNERYREVGYNNIEHLQVLNDVRVREVQRLSEQLQEVRTFAAEEKEKLSRELILMEANKERAESLHREAEKQLFASKEKIDELEKEVETLKHNLSSLEVSNTQLKQDLESSQASNMDLQQKLLLLERSSLSNTSKHYDSFVKNCQKKHEQELQALKTEIGKLSAKLENKETDCDRLERRVAELTRAQETLIIEKAEIVNQMERSLGESQRQCQQLMETAVSQDNVRLTMQLSVISQEKEHLDNKVQEMKKEVEGLKFDLQQYENATHLGILNNEDSLFTDSMIQLGIAKKSSYSNTNFSKNEQSNSYIKLRDEYHRCLLGQKIKREEIQRLKSELKKKDEIIKKLKDEEVKYLTGVEKFKEDVGKLVTQLKEQDRVTKEIEDCKKKNEEILNQLKKSESEVSQVNSELICITKARDDLKNENAQLKQKIDKIMMDFQNEKVHSPENCSKEYLRFHEEAISKVKEENNKKAEAKIAELSVQLNEALKESEDVKLMYLDICGVKERLLEQLHEAQENVKDLTNKLQNKKKELDVVSEELSSQRTLSQKLSDELKDSQKKLDSLTQALEQEKIKSKEQQMIIRDSENYKETFQKNVYEEARQLYATRVIEEINTAKEQVLKEVEHGWKKQENGYNIKIKQLSDTCTLLQEKIMDYDEKCTEAENYKKEIQELQTKLQQQEFSVVQLQMKEKLMLEQHFMKGTICLSLKDANTSTRIASEETESVTTECARLHSAELEALRLKYQSELKEQQERIKQETVDYFQREILNIETKHKLILQESEAAAAKKLSSLQDLIVTKTHELDVLKQTTDDERVKLQTSSDDMWREKIKMLTNELFELKSSMKKNSVSEQEKHIATLKLCLEMKEKQLEDIRNKVSELITNCNREVQSLRQSNGELNLKYSDCVAKYNTAKMKAMKYKKLADEKVKHVMKDFDRIKEGYQNTLSTIKEKVEEAVSNKETVINPQAIALEKQIQLLKRKQSRYEAVA